MSEVNKSLEKIKSFLSTYHITNYIAGYDIDKKYALEILDSIKKIKVLKEEIQKVKEEFGNIYFNIFSLKIGWEADIREQFSNSHTRYHSFCHNFEQSIIFFKKACDKNDISSAIAKLEVLSLTVEACIKLSNKGKKIMLELQTKIQTYLSSLKNIENKYDMVLDKIQNENIKLQNETLTENLEEYQHYFQQINELKTKTDTFNDLIEHFLRFLNNTHNVVQHNKSSLEKELKKEKTPEKINELLLSVYEKLRVNKNSFQKGAFKFCDSSDNICQIS